MKKSLALGLLLLIAISWVFAQTTGDYQTAESVVGTWNTPGTWQKFSGSAWVTATTAPSKSDGVITIRSGATVTVSGTVQADQLIIASGGEIIVASAAILEIHPGTAPDLAVYGKLTVNYGGTLSLKKVGGHYADANIESGGSLYLYGTLEEEAAGNSANETNTVFLEGGYFFLGPQSLLTGGGNLTLENNSTVETQHPLGISLPTGFGADDITFGTAVNFIFSGTAENVITGGIFPATVGNLTINNPNGITLSGSVSVSGTLNIEDGEIDFGVDINNQPNTMNVYDFVSEEFYYFEIPESAIQIANFGISTAKPALYPAKINRSWAISGAWESGSINCKFYWDAADDNEFDWITSGIIPGVYKGETTFYQAIDSSLNTSRRYVIVSIPASDDLNKGAYTIGPPDNDTLPVELSAFSAALNNQNEVTIQWITQSETNVSGFRLYRNIEPQLETATMLNIFIPGTNTSQQQLYLIIDQEVQQSGTYYYWLENIDLDGSSVFYGPITMVVNLDNNNIPEIPLIQGLNNAYPNPFHPEVNLVLSMEKDGWMELEIYNLKGQKVRTIFSGNMSKGKTKMVWDARTQQGQPCSNGIYFAIMRTRTGSVSKMKLVLMK